MNQGMLGQKGFDMYKNYEKASKKVLEIYQKILPHHKLPHQFLMVLKLDFYKKAYFHWERRIHPYLEYGHSHNVD